MGDVEAGLTAICIISPPTKVCSSNGFGEPQYSTKPLPHCHCWRESRIPNFSRLKSAPRGSAGLQAPSCRDKLGKGSWWRGRRDGCPVPRDPKPPPATHRSTADHGMAGDLWILLFTSIRDRGEGIAEVKRLAHVSVKSDTGGIVAPQREAAAKPCVVPDLRQQLPLGIQHQEAQGSCQSSMKGSRAKVGRWDPARAVTTAWPSASCSLTADTTGILLGTATQWK